MSNLQKPKVCRDRRGQPVLRAASHLADDALAASQRRYAGAWSKKTRSASKRWDGWRKWPIEEAGVGLRIETASDWRDVLPDADFVVLSFAADTVHYRGLDCQISEKYGVRMCSGDTIGPGGIFRAMRELPLIMDCVADIERLCPEAWVINYINPSTVQRHGDRSLRSGGQELRPLRFAAHATCQDSLCAIRRSYCRCIGMECRTGRLTSICVSPASITSPGC